jgi:type VI protein secretion system component VasK
MAKFLREPVTTRGAVSTIVSSTFVIVVASGVLMRVLDHREYPNVFVGMWWAVQTVTTVGYGDVTPAARIGRLVATVVMLEGIALIAIVTAAVTSTFVARADKARQKTEEAGRRQEEERIDARFDELAAELELIKAMLRTSPRP